MKKIIISLFVALLFSACEKDVIIYDPGNMEYGMATAKKNGADWKASTYCGISNSPRRFFTVAMRTYYQNIVLREAMSFNFIPTNVGKYKIHPMIFPTNIEDTILTSHYWFLIDDGDVVGDSYTVDDSVSDNEIEVTYIDTIAGIARGRFKVTFKVDKPKKESYLPDCVEFSEGSFNVTFL